MGNPGREFALLELSIEAAGLKCQPINTHDHTTLTGCTMSRLFSGARTLALRSTTFAASFATSLPQIGFAETPRVTAASPSASSGASQAAVRAVEFTYLKSQPGERDNLRQAIVANWLAMDAIAVQQGLMVDYKVFGAGNDDGEWNIKVMVVYPDARSHASNAALSSLGSEAAQSLGATATRALPRRDSWCPANRSRGRSCPFHR